jgi:hypothetical protein
MHLAHNGWLMAFQYSFTVLLHRHNYNLCVHDLEFFTSNIEQSLPNSAN